MPGAVAEAGDELAVAIDAIAERMRNGGRLVYVGAGSSGLIAALDAGECEATFSTEPGQVVALVAGAGLASAQAREAAEDDAESGRRAIEELGVSERDAVVGVSASGRTPTSSPRSSLPPPWARSRSRSSPSRTRSSPAWWSTSLPRSSARSSWRARHD